MAAAHEAAAFLFMQCYSYLPVSGMIEATGLIGFAHHRYVQCLFLRNVSKQNARFSYGFSVFHRVRTRAFKKKYNRYMF